MDSSSITAVAVVLAIVLLFFELQALANFPLRELLAVLQMWANPEDAATHMRGCKEIADQCLADRASKELFLWAGALDQAIHSMTTFAEHSQVQRACAYLVAAASQGHAEARAAAGQGGAIELMLRAMERFADDPDMQYAGAVGALLVMSPFHRMRWAEARGMEVTMAAARRHPNNSFVQFEAWCALAAGSGEPNEPRFEQLGGIDLAVAALRAGESRVREQVMQAMRAITAHSDELRSAVVRSGFVEEVVAAMNDAPLDVRRQAAACGSLGGIAEGDDEHLDALVRTHAIDAIVAAVRAYPRMPGIASEYGLRYSVYGDCFKALEGLSVSSSAKTAILAALTKEDVILGMRSEPEDWKVQTGGAALLRILAD